jgi:hypothetical protein
VGGYVEVEYVAEGGVNRIVEIETNVPPGAGDDDKLGVIESMGSTGVMAVAAENWVIGGQTYAVDVATKVVDNDGTLAVGSQVYVNSYTNGNGEQAATLIRPAAMDAQLFIPIANR